MRVSGLLLLVALPLYSQSSLTEMAIPSSGNKATLTLEDVMDKAEEFSYSVKIQDENVAIAKSLRNKVWTRALPRLSTSGQLMYMDDKVNKTVGKTIGSSDVPEKVQTVSLTVTQPISNLLVIGSAIKGANHYKESADLSKDYQSNEARYLGAVNYVNATKAKALVEVMQKNYELAKSQFNEAQVKFRIDNITKADLLSFQLSFENSKNDLLKAQNVYLNSLTVLAEAIGLENADQFSLPESKDGIWEKKAMDSSDEMLVINTVLEERKDLKSLREQLEYQKYVRVKSALAYTPDIYFVAKYERDFMKKDINIPAKNNDPGVYYAKKDIRDSLSYGVTLSWELWDWGERQFQISEDSARVRQVNHQLRAKESQARVEVQQAFLQLKYAKNALASAKISEELADETLRQTKIAFDAGKKSTTELISAATSKANAQSALVTARGELDLAWLNYYRSKGQKLSSEITQ